MMLELDDAQVMSEMKKKKIDKLNPDLGFEPQDR